MAATVLSNVIVPEVFNPYVINRTMELSALWTSGIIANVPGIDLGDVGSQKGGKTVHMPFWNDLTGDDQILSTGTNLTVANITADQDIAVLNARALVYGSKDLVAPLAGSDPMSIIGDLIAGKWVRRMQAALIAILNGAVGALAAESPDVNVFDISGLVGEAAVADAESIIDAVGMLGDAEGQLTAVAMHSNTERHLRKQNLIDYQMDSNNQPIAFYMGKRIIIDDGMPVAGGVYTTFFFGPGAIGYSEGTPRVPSEVERNGLVGGGEEYLISRRHFVLHPRGIKWIGSPAADTPTNAELATAGNWDRVWESKQIRLVAFKHRLVAA